jgi:hypothetical protein
MHDSNTIIMFADDTPVVGLIINDDEAAYKGRSETWQWCQNNKFSLIVSKTKELIMDYRKLRSKHSPIHIDGAVVEWVESFKFLGVQITKEFT